jgi:hypothetical protein
MNTPRLSQFPFLDPAEPLRLRAPTVDEDGNAVTDFMMIFPGLRKKTSIQINEALRDVQMVLSRYSDVVVFAEMNIGLNLLWVSIKPVTGKRFEIAEAMRGCIPDAKLVSHV